MKLFWVLTQSGLSCPHCLSCVHRQKKVQINKSDLAGFKQADFAATPAGSDGKSMPFKEKDYPITINVIECRVL